MAGDCAKRMHAGVSRRVAVRAICGCVCARERARVHTRFVRVCICGMTFTGYVHLCTNPPQFPAPAPHATHQLTHLPPPHTQLQYPMMVAPAAVLLIAWIAMGGHQGHALTHFLFLVLMSSVVLVALRLPRLASIPFVPAAAAGAFPADVTAKGAVLYTHLYQAQSTVMVCSPSPGPTQPVCLPVPFGFLACVCAAWVCVGAVHVARPLVPVLRGCARAPGSHH